MRIGDRVQMIDRYASRCPGADASWFDGLKGVITRIKPTVLVHLDGESAPTVFDARDFVVLGGESGVAMVAGD